MSLQRGPAGFPSWRLLCILLLASLPCSPRAYVEDRHPVGFTVGQPTEGVGDDDAEGSTVSVRDPWEFRRAMEDQGVVRILVARDMELRPYNGWWGVELVGRGGSGGAGRPLYPSRNVTIESHPDRAEPATVDMGDIQPLGSLVQPGNVVVEVKRLIVTSLHPTQHDALRQDLGQSSFIITDCIVKMVGTRDQMRFLLQEGSDAEQTSGTMRNLTHVPSGDCQGGGHVSNCPDGGLYVESWSKKFGFDGSSGMVSVSRSLITLEVVEHWAASKASDIATGLRLHRDVLVSVSPVSVVMNLTCQDFGTPGSPLAVGINATVSGGEVGSARYVFDFNHMQDCIEVRPEHEVIIQGLEIRGAAGAGNLARMLPFFHVLFGASLVVENSVVVVHTGTANKYSIQDLHHEIGGITASDSSEGDLNITVVPFSKFWDDGMLVGSTRGVLVSGATVGSHRTGEDSSMAGIIHLKHTFFVRDVDLPHHPRVVSPNNVAGSEAPHAPSASGAAWIGMFWGVASFLVLVAAVVAAVKFKMQQRRQQQFFCLHDGDSSTEPCESLAGGSAGGSAGASSEATRISSASAKEVALQEHRSVPDKLLKALALGPLIGRGSFGHVYKATWNGAPVAVKVIYHPPTSAAAKTDAEREAMLSSSLRHPNIVQTFLEATRDMVHNTNDEELAMSEQHGANKYVKIKQVVDNRTPLLEKPPKPLLKRVVLENWRPPFPSSVLPGYAKLAQECWETDPACRPAIDAVLERLEALVEVVRSLQ
eukprot:evm.model.scf_1329.4 EVM.evm.TU.scf_1329.4   scf_1329:24471-29795(+)